ncbi:MAG: nucleotidyltransferase domain-containing protein [Holophagales bacterium]|jgi:predicted nucleotidyltransferase|nr:nucleotidyltransferase domain-containing protein [Holophagales bacterium]
MRNLISQKLKEIELNERVCVLHAVESGSRAWGFASPDSDYDVRFVYLRETNFYLKLEHTRDVIEWQLDKTLDINGWDLQKALRLLHKANPTLFEWTNSPIVYKTTPEWQAMSKHFAKYFSPKSCMYSYLHMAEGNYKEYLKHDLVRPKKYLYVIRPILACKWVLRNNTPPPVLFSELVAAEAGAELTQEIDKLLRIKLNTPELEEAPKIAPLNDFIEETLPLLREQMDSLPEGRVGDFDGLNRLFLDALASGLV